MLSFWRIFFDKFFDIENWNKVQFVHQFFFILGGILGTNLHAEFLEILLQKSRGIRYGYQKIPYSAKSKKSTSVDTLVGRGGGSFKSYSSVSDVLNKFRR